MNLLIDAQALLWAAERPERLTSRAREALIGRDHTRYLSDVTCWELAIKQGLGKLTLGGTVAEFVSEQSEALELGPVGIRREHIYALSRLPLHHGDPFDRLLIAQAIVEGMTIVTSDRAIMRYAVETLW